jgi:thioredoxin 1
MSDNNKKILRFTASWCQTCKMLAKNLEEANLGIPIEVVDIDVNRELAQEYNIRSVPTLVMKRENTESRLVGLQTTTKLKLWALE